MMKWKPHIRKIAGRWVVGWRSFDGKVLRAGFDIWVPRSILQGRHSMAAHHYVKRLNAA